MRAKTVLVTGASSGTGLAMARALAKLGASVVMVSRDADRAHAARAEVAAAATGAPPTVLLADLSSQAEVRRLAAEVRVATPSLDVLINNAGAAFRTRQLTVDGVERTFATNHLAPFLLTALLLDPLRAAPAGRVVTVTASLQSRAIDFDNLDLERGYGMMRAYALSKACNVLFTYELARRLEGSNVTANCFTPGPTDTNFARTAGGILGMLFHVVGFFGLLRSAEDATRPGVYLASSPEAAAVTGAYLDRDGEPAKSARVTYDREVAARLWSVSEALCSEQQPNRARAASPGDARSLVERARIG